MDLANIIDAPTRERLNRQLTELENKTTAQMVVLTINSLEGQPIEEFSHRTLVKWGVGRKGKDNGVLLTVAVKDRKYRIEEGYGLEGALPDSLVGTIGRERLVPHFRSGAYGLGIAAAVSELAHTIAAARTKYFQAPDTKGKIEATGDFERALSRLLVLREAHPDLKANETFRKLMDSLEGAENRISVKRKRYNDAVCTLNTYVATVFGRFFAGLADVGPAAYYQAPEAEKEAPKVKF